MRPGRTAGDIARMLGMTRQAVQWHMKRIREGA
jgi:biotin operon repressor